MKNYFYLPSTNLIGVGCLENLGRELTVRGFKKALIVSDKNLVEIGHVGKVEQILKDNDIEYTVYDGVERPNPNVDDVERGFKFLDSTLKNLIGKNYDLVISLGGGTNHDAAKSIAALATNGGTINDYEGQNKFKEPALPWVAINTTAGAGAQYTMLDMITDDQRKTKMSITDPKLLATLTVNDPILHVTAQKEVTTSAGIDVLAQAVEAFVALNATPLTDVLALGAIKLFFDNIKKVVANGNDLDARGNMMYAAGMAAIAFNNAGLGHGHSIVHQIGGFSYRHHGLASGVILPYILEFNAPSIPIEKFIDMANAMGLEGVSGTNAVAKVLEAIRKINAEINVPDNLSEMGAKEEDIKYYAEMALKDVAGFTNPRQATLEDMIQIIRKAMKLDVRQEKVERELVLR